MSPVAIEAIFERVPRGPSSDSPVAVRFGVRARLESRPDQAPARPRRGPGEAARAVEAREPEPREAAAGGPVLAYTALAALRFLLPPQAHPGALGLHLDARA